MCRKGFISAVKNEKKTHSKILRFEKKTFEEYFALEKLNKLLKLPVIFLEFGIQEFLSLLEFRYMYIHTTYAIHMYFAFFYRKDISCIIAVTRGTTIVSECFICIYEKHTICTPYHFC